MGCISDWVDDGSRLEKHGGPYPLSFCERFGSDHSSGRVLLVDLLFGSHAGNEVHTPAVAVLESGSAG